MTYINGILLEQGQISLHVFFIIHVVLIINISGYTRHYDVKFEPEYQIIPQFSDTKLRCVAHKITEPFRTIFTEIRKGENPPLDIDICDIDEYEYECYEPNAKCETCITNKTFSELDIQIKNVTLEDRGRYRCNVMGNVQKYATIDIAIPPKTVDCHNVLNKSESTVIIECLIGCMYPDPKVEISEEHKIIVGLSDMTKNCKSPMKKYRTVYAVSKISNEPCEIKVSGIGFSRNIKVIHDSVNDAEDFDERFTIHYFIILVLTGILALLAGALIVIIIRRHKKCNGSDRQTKDFQETISENLIKESNICIQTIVQTDNKEEDTPQNRSASEIIDVNIEENGNEGQGQGVPDNISENSSATENDNIKGNGIEECVPDNLSEKREDSCVEIYDGFVHDNESEYQSRASSRESKDSGIAGEEDDDVKNKQCIREFPRKKRRGSVPVCYVQVPIQEEGEDYSSKIAV